MIFCHILEKKSFKNKYSVTLLHPTKGSNGYPVVNLTINGKSGTYTVHRLLAKSFIPNPTNLPCINHKDRNRLNFSLDNLEWCTYEYNNRHAIKMGVNRAFGENTSFAKLKNKQALAIFKSKKSRKYLSEKYNVSMSCIDDIKKGVNWSWLTGKKYTPRKRFHLIEHDGITKNVKQWANFFKVNDATLHERISKGQSFDDIYSFYKKKNEKI